MKPHYQDDEITLYHGDCLDVLAALPEASVDAVVTDPPYGISFMGRQWDQPGKFGSQRGDGRPRGGHANSRGMHDAMAAGSYDLSPAAMLNFQQWCTEWASECLRVLKPGGHLLAFGGSRTWHRLAAAIEDAGFEVRDSIAWLYGSGFPKSLDVSKAIDKSEGIRRGRAGAVSSDNGSMSGGNYERTPKGEPATEAAIAWAGWGTALKPAFEPIVVARKPLAGTVAANVLEHGTGALNIDACRIGDEVRVNPPGSTNPRVAMGDGWRADAEARMASGRWPTNVVLDDTQAAELDAQSGTLKSGLMRAGTKRAARDGAVYGRLDEDATPRDTYADSGGASRFFPVFRYEAKAPGTERPSANGVAHPTVKPLDLMRWLVRLVTPPNGVVLDPFAGSGTTAESCVHEHKRCITIEREADYLPLIVNRLSKPMAIGFDFEEPA
ncbi:DNA methyltransferase [Mycobacterium phage ThulaThula]|uniref:DNA methylase n=1 Tax=Mycobacterium phage ThulaThula TaxID=2599880 RepID=A0A5J6THB3_9CAUD|nr:DNA methyltransferase [Mycobacterium phage ThulaThula]QFG09089.1 DNA methylase [Mycobacterium phage ThulaThula]